MSRKNILSPEVWQKKILTQITHIHRPSQKSNGRPLILAGAVTAFACGKINEYFGFWFKKLSKSNSYGTTVKQTKVYWRTDSYVFEGKKVCDTVWALQPSVVPAPVMPLPTVLLSKLPWCYKCSSTFQTFIKGSCICCLNQGNRLDPVWTNGIN